MDRFASSEKEINSEMNPSFLECFHELLETIQPQNRDESVSELDITGVEPSVADDNVSDQDDIFLALESALHNLQPSPQNNCDSNPTDYRVSNETINSEMNPTFLECFHELLETIPAPRRGESQPGSELVWGESSITDDHISDHDDIFHALDHARHDLQPSTPDHVDHQHMLQRGGGNVRRLTTITEGSPCSTSTRTSEAYDAPLPAPSSTLPRGGVAAPAPAPSSARTSVAVATPPTASSSTRSQDDVITPAPAPSSAVGVPAPAPSSTAPQSGVRRVRRQRFNNLELRRSFTVPPGGPPDLCQFYQDIMVILAEMAENVRQEVRRGDHVQLEIRGENVQNHVTISVDDNDAILQAFEGLLEKLIQSNAGIASSERLDLIPQIVHNPSGGSADRVKTLRLLNDELVSKKRRHLYMVGGRGDQLCFAISLAYVLKPGCTDFEAEEEGKRLQSMAGLSRETPVNFNDIPKFEANV